MPFCKRCNTALNLGHIIKENGFEEDLWCCPKCKRKFTNEELKIINDKYIGTQAIFKGYICSVDCVLTDQYYKLTVMQKVDDEKLSQDKAFYKDILWNAIAKPYICSHCGDIIWVNTDISKDQYKCTKCNAILDL